jgi:hypothetical protein
LEQDVVIEVEKYKVGKKRKEEVVISRLVVTLNFSEHTKIDYELVNRKWQKHLIQQKVDR